jgi:pyrophosphatase PpaX
MTDTAPFPGIRGATSAYVAVLFDLDGTLLDTTDLIFQSYQHALAEVLDPPPTTAELLLGYGQPLYAAFSAILDARASAGLDDDRPALVERLIQLYRAFNVAQHDRLAREFPGVQATLAELGRRGYPLGLVTSKARSIGERGLRLGGLDRLFQTTVYMDDTARHKPEPDPLWLALDRLGLRDRADHVLYVGDSTHDLRAGRAAGVHTAAALWGPFPPDSLTELAPDHALASIEALLGLFPKRG